MKAKTKTQPGIKGNDSGLTLLEVIITVGLLLSLSVASTTMIRNSINMRQALSDNADVGQRLSRVMQKVVNDLQHGFMLNSKKTEINWGGRATKTVFLVEQTGDNTRLSLTTMSHQPMLANSYETDQTFVVYELRPDDAGGRTSLWRGESRVLPESFREDPHMELLASDVKTFKITPWSGDGWLRDKWDSSRTDQRNRLPFLIKIELEVWDEPKLESDNDQVDDSTSPLSSVVYLPQSFGMEEMKQRSQTLKWF